LNHINQPAGLSPFEQLLSSDLGDETYWAETRRPVCSLAFLLPLLVVYELGVLLVGGEHAVAYRNGADYWLREFLAGLGLAWLWLPPMLLVGALAMWQTSSRQPWRVQWETLSGMLAESLLFAFMLVLSGQALHACFLPIDGQPMSRVPMSESGEPQLVLSSLAPVRLVTFLGAGLYEEFVFRLCLIPLGFWLAKGLLLSDRWAWMTAIVGSSLLFSLAHYLAPESDGLISVALWNAAAQIFGSPREFLGFIFRFVAGLVFATIFCWRGFGIAAGSHAAYDISVGVLMG
jgi:membrane protease YdiL (CAAX protease family)